jgi:hypothetical protein
LLTHINALTVSAAFLAVTFLNWLVFRKISQSRHRFSAILLAVAAAGFVTNAVWFGFWND